jgi:hypothetical protein
MMVEGSALGVFWLLSVVLNRSECVRIKATMDYSSAFTLTFMNWMTASNIRLFVLLIQVCFGDLTMITSG